VIKPTSSKDNDENESSSLLHLDDLTNLQKLAQSTGLGIFAACDAEISKGNNIDGISFLPKFEAQFEPLERTMDTIWMEDGGRRQLRTDSSKSLDPPVNPGDMKGCSDFKTYEEALQWFERYMPYYGDVARLDRDGDGVPCPGLPHTSNMEIYRMKIPNKKNGM
jgi:hypothetical protein